MFEAIFEGSRQAKRPLTQLTSMFVPEAPFEQSPHMSLFPYSLPEAPLPWVHLYPKSN